MCHAPNMSALASQTPHGVLSGRAKYYRRCSFVELFHEAAGAASAPHSACLLSSALQEPLCGSCYCDAASRRQILAPTPAAAAFDFSTAPDSPDCIKLPGSNTDCLLLQCPSTVAGACVVLTQRTISCCNKRVSLPPRMAQALPSPPLFIYSKDSSYIVSAGPLDFALTLTWEIPPPSLPSLEYNQV